MGDEDAIWVISVLKPGKAVNILARVGKIKAAVPECQSYKEAFL
jgi:hypothetical protein